VAEGARREGAVPEDDRDQLAAQIGRLPGPIRSCRTSLPAIKWKPCRHRRRDKLCGIS